MIDAESKHAAKFIKNQSDSEFRRLRSALGNGDNARVILVSCLRCADSYFTVTRLVPDPEPSDVAAWQLIYRGINLVLRLLMPSVRGARGFPSLRHNPEMGGFASGALQLAGRIEVSRRLSVLLERGLVAGSVKENTVSLRLLHREGERNDNDELRWLMKKHASSGPLLSPALDHVKEDVLRQMSSLVSPWMEHYIQYTTTPSIDEYYRIVAWDHTRRNFIDPESFPGEARFRGLRYDTIRQATLMGVEFALKHAEFSTLLCKANSEISYNDIATIWCDDSELQACFSAELGCSSNEARRLFELQTLEPEDTPNHLVDFDPAQPCYVRIAENMVIRPLYGALGNPWGFLLRKLRCTYNKDWQKNAKLREQVFRRQLSQLYSGQRYVVAQNEMQIEEDGVTITDVDAAIFDRQSGTLALFQLKWQDMIGMSLSERNSRASNFVNKANEWVARMSAWVSRRALSEVAGHLLPTELEGDVRRLKLFVIARYYARFGGVSSLSRDAAWGTWAQVVRISTSASVDSDALSELHAELAREQEAPFVHDFSKSYDSPNVFQIGNVTIEIEDRVEE